MVAPNCYIIAGPNGAGKTTFATEFLPRFVQCTNFVNPDLIASGLSPFNPSAAAFHAGRIVIEQIESFMRSGLDFSFETTLSGRAYRSTLDTLRVCGYRIHLFYLWIPNVELAMLRIGDRVRKGGHTVPEYDVQRRFARSLQNVRSVYRPMIDVLQYFDNSGSEPRIVFEEKDGRLSVYDQIFYRQLFQSISGTSYD